MEKIKVIGISGSLRSGSYNRKLLRLAMDIAAAAGVEVTEVDLRQPLLPIYDKDVETVGLPQAVIDLKQAVASADVLFIASPEYNYSIPGGLKNALDWLSRGGNSLDGKVAAIMGASNGLSGTVRMQPHLRAVLGALDVLVLPQPQVFVRTAGEAFDAEGQLKDPAMAQRLQSLVAATLALAEQRRVSKSA